MILRYARFGLLLPALLVLAPLAHAEGDGLASLRDKATTLFRQGKYDEAIQYYKQLIVLQPKNPDAHKDLMWALWQNRRYEETVSASQRVIQLIPDDAEAWNLKARAQQAAGDRPGALKSFQKSLSLSPDNSQQLREVIEALEADTRNYDSAPSAELKKMGQEGLPNRASSYSRLGQAQYRKGLYGAAAETWLQAAEKFPDNVNFQFNAAKSLYYGGQQDKAVAKLKTIILANPGYWPAVDFLVDDAISRGDSDSVEVILENNFSEYRVEDEPRVLRLAGIYQAAKKYSKCAKLLERFLNVNPNNGDALLLYGEVLMSMKRYEESVEAYEKVSERNPWSKRARLGMAEAYAARRESRKSLKIVQDMRKLDPSDPYLIAREAVYLYESGLRAESKKRMLEWIAENPEPAVPVLLYHGLTPMARDAMLAYSVHMTTATFEDHMAALQMARYTPISAEQLDGWSRWLRTLPSKPVLITFDDGRLDSFKYGDPILERYGMRATMFAIMDNVEANLPGYANWEMLGHYMATGRWQIQAHGDHAHGYIPIDAEGRMGHFVANRMWLDKEKRMESLQEWAERVLTDHRTVKKKIAERLQRSPVSYAFPEGEFGQDRIPNDPQAGTLNLTLARKVFGTAFHQDQYGLNVRSRDSMLLTRKEPSATWTGEQLVRHLTDKTPKMIMYRRLLRQACWDGHIHEAYGWLTKVKENDASRAVELADEARIRFSAGDLSRARRLALRSMTIEKDQDIERLLESVQIKQRFGWSPQLLYWKDNQERTLFEARNNFDFKLWGNTRMNLHQTFAEYEEEGTPTVQIGGAGGGISTALGLYHRVYAEMTGLTISDQARTYSAKGTWQAKWTDYVTMDLTAERTPYDTARAVNNHIFSKALRLRTEWLDPKGYWRTSFKGYASEITDDNNRFTGEFQLGYQFFPQHRLRGVYRGTVDDMKNVSPFYYSPQSVVQNQLGVEYNTSNQKPVEFYVYYLPGIGTDRKTKPEFIHSLEVGLDIKSGETFRLAPSFALTTTPSYNRQFYAVQLKKLF